jgi:DNA-binding transcriptional ArsR family regulator
MSGSVKVPGEGSPASRPATPPTRETIHHPSPDALDLAQILRTVGDPLRLAMVRDLAAHDELLCGALGDRLGLPKSTGSYHLRLLREAGLTRTRQEGTLRYVSLRRGDLEARFPGLVGVLAAGAPD